MMSVRGGGRFVALAVIGIMGAGCGGSASKYDKLHPVSGTITFDGQPLDGATVAFIPAKSKQVQPSFGYTDATGKYVLQTPEGNKGVSPGEYRIVVSKLQMPDGTPIPPGSQTGGADGNEIVPYPHCDPRATQNIAIVTGDSGVFDVSISSEAPKNGPAARKKS